MTPSHNLRRAIAAGVVSILLTVTTTACFGTFALTRKVYNFNRTVSDNQFVCEAIFLLMAIFPIYFAGLFIDVVFSNLLEFWTGTSPIIADSGRSKVLTGPAGEKLSMTLRADGAIEFVIVRSDGRSQTLVVTRSGTGTEARDEQGKLIARVGDMGGRPALIASGTAR